MLKAIIGAASSAKMNTPQAVKWVARLGEVLLLAAAIRLAAGQSNSIVVSILAYLMLIAAAFHLSEPLVSMSHHLATSTMSKRGVVAALGPFAVLLIFVAVSWLATRELAQALDLLVRNSFSR